MLRGCFFKPKHMETKDYIGRLITLHGDTFKIKKLNFDGLAVVKHIETGEPHEIDIHYSGIPSKLKFGVKLVPVPPKNDFFPLY